MKALVYQDHKTVSYLDVPDPSIEAPTDAIVRIEKTAICGSDLHIYHGPSRLEMGEFTLGHEFLGTVEDVGSDVRRFKKRDRVLVSCTIGCGGCALCDDDLLQMRNNVHPTDSVQHVGTEYCRRSRKAPNRQKCRKSLKAGKPRLSTKAQMVDGEMFSPMRTLIYTKKPGTKYSVRIARPGWKRAPVRILRCVNYF